MEPREVRIEHRITAAERVAMHWVGDLLPAVGAAAIAFWLACTLHAFVKAVLS